MARMLRSEVCSARVSFCVGHDQEVVGEGVDQVQTMVGKVGG